MFGKTIISSPLICTRTFAYQRVRSVNFLENFAYLLNESSNVKSDVYADLAKDVEARFDTSNYELISPLPIGKNKVIELMKIEFVVRIMKEFLALRPKSYSY